MARQAIRLLIEGRVQGVGYRWWTENQAARLGVDGWVRNRRDGSVELLAIGEAEAVDGLEAACREGPPGARVTRVTRGEAEDDGSRGFASRPTV